MRGKPILVLTGTGVLAALGFAMVHLLGTGEVQEVRTSLSVAEVMGEGAADGFARALEPRPFAFPEDHGPHWDFRTEWWYLTGNLQGPGGEPLGFQFTVFRSALAPEAPAGGSAWVTNQVFMGHFAVMDGEVGGFRAYERFARGAVGLAGAQAEPFRVWVEDWAMEGPAEGAGPEPAGSLFPLRLAAGEGGESISLVLRPSKPMVLQGDRGLSRKGPEPGNASYYYSFTRLEAEGTLTFGGREIPVRGNAWLDREWSTSALSPEQVGWDWFAIQLSDGRDLMYYRLRQRDGTPDSLSKGILVGRGGGSRLLDATQVDLSVLETWESPLGGSPYPSRWRLAVPEEAIDLEIVPVLPHQELDLTFRYWEGAVRVLGAGASPGLQGRGYVELTGYADLPRVEESPSLGRGITVPQP